MGTALKELRLRKGLTTKQMGELIGVSQATAWRIEAMNESGKATPIAEVLEAKMKELPDDPKRFQTFDKRRKKKCERVVRPVITHPPVGREITMLRKAYGYTQEILGDMIGISSQEVSHLECGHYNPDPYISECLCDIFGIAAEKDTGGAVRTGSGARF